LKIALIAPPFIAVPPADYGGTELFLAHLAEGLQQLGLEVIVYTNRESTVRAERRWIYGHSDWPIKNPEHAFVQDLNNEAWAVHDATEHCDIIHVQSAPAITFSRFIERPRSSTSSRTSVLSAELLRLKAPITIDVAQRTGIPLKIAGDVQPMYHEYFERKVKPQIDGKLVDYMGLADLQAKNELLGNSMAMLFPIQWNEPFGLVMLEAMAYGTPVLAMPGGSVPEVVREGISGHICRSVVQMAKRAQGLNFKPLTVRQYVENNFSIERMAKEYARLYGDILQGIDARRIA